MITIFFSYLSSYILDFLSAPDFKHHWARKTNQPLLEFYLYVQTINEQHWENNSQHKHHTHTSLPSQWKGIKYKQLRPWPSCVRKNITPTLSNRRCHAPPHARQRCDLFHSVMTAAFICLSSAVINSLHIVTSKRSTIRVFFPAPPPNPKHAPSHSCSNRWAIFGLHHLPKLCLIAVLPFNLALAPMQLHSCVRHVILAREKMIGTLTLRSRSRTWHTKNKTKNKWTHSHCSCCNQCQLHPGTGAHGYCSRVCEFMMGQRLQRWQHVYSVMSNLNQTGHSWWFKTDEHNVRGRVGVYHNLNYFVLS